MTYQEIKQYIKSRGGVMRELDEDTWDYEQCCMCHCSRGHYFKVYASWAKRNTFCDACASYAFAPPSKHNQRKGVRIYTDGAIDDSGKTFAWAIIVERQGRFFCAEHGSGSAAGRRRSTDIEMLAAQKAMDYVEKHMITHAVIVHDCEAVNPEGKFFHDELGQGYSERAVRLKHQGRISFQKVRAHSGVRGNREVDKLCRTLLHNERFNNPSVFRSVIKKLLRGLIKLLQDGGTMSFYY